MNVIVILILDKLYYDVLLRLDLEHLQDETHEGSQLSVAAVGSAEVVELHGFVDERLRCETKALLLPLGVLVNLRPENFLHQVLWIRLVDRLRHRIRTVFHQTLIALETLELILQSTRSSCLDRR